MEKGRKTVVFSNLEGFTCKLSAKKWKSES